MTYIDIYNEVKNNYQNIIEIDNDEQAAIEERIKNDKQKNKTNRYLIIITLATLTILISPYFISKIYQSLDVIVNYLNYKKGHYTSEYINIINVSLAIGGIAILIYLFFPYSHFLSSTSEKNLDSFYQINKKQTTYILYSIISCYIVLGFILYIFQLNDFKYSNFVIIILKFYLLIPMSIIFILGLMILLTLSSKMLPNHVDKFEYSSNERIEISFILLNILRRIKDHNRTHLISEKESNETIKDLRTVSYLVRNYSREKNNLNLNKSIDVNFNQSANFIDQLTIDFQTTDDLNKRNIKDRLITFFNIILQGNLLDLPKLEIENEFVKPIKKIKLYHYLLLAIYLALPIIVLIATNLFFKISLSEYNQSLVRILYVIWAVVGVFSNPIILNPDNKEFIKDIVKQLFGKG